MLLLLLTALAVSFRTCFRKLIIPAMGQKRKKNEKKKLALSEKYYKTQITSQGCKQKANRTNVTN